MQQLPERTRRGGQAAGAPLPSWLGWLGLGAACATLAVAVMVRLSDLQAMGLNADEAVYAGQAAALAGQGGFADLFGVFRAHPLLVQFVTSLLFRAGGVNDVTPRLVAVGAGVALVATTGLLALVVRGRVAAIIAMILVAVSAYPVTVSRQFLLDGPEALFVALSLLFLALHVRRPGRPVLFAAAVSAGLAFLCKETAILLLPAIIVFFVTVPGARVRLVDGLLFMGVYLFTISPFPLSLMLGGGTRTAQEFLVWQIFRRPNHDYAFYLTSLQSAGLPLVLLAVVGVVAVAWRRRPAHALLVLTTLVIAGFYELWPVKGYQYLTPLVAPVAVLAAEGAMALGAVFAVFVLGAHEATSRRVAAEGATAVVVLAALLGASAVSGLDLRQPVTAIVATNADAAAAAVADASDETDGGGATPFLAGTGGLDGGRAAGRWIGAHTLRGSNILTIGPSFANVISFYGLRRARGLSVSNNPLRRNPSYVATENPDLLVRTGAVQYLAWDAFSANRSPVFAHKLLDLVHKYHGVKVYTGYPTAAGAAGGRPKPVVIVYEVHP